jgi:DNA-binding protein HU-beta
MAKMTQTQIINEMATKTGISKKQVKDFMTSLTDLAYREAKKGGEFAFPGLGKLVKQKRKARLGRNPATGEEIKIPAKTVLKFRVAKAAKDAVLGAAKK